MTKKPDSGNGWSDAVVPETGSAGSVEPGLTEILEQIGDTSPSDSLSDAETAALAELQSILLNRERTRIQDLLQEVEGLRAQLQDQESLADSIAPVLGAALQRQIREQKSEIVEALYPIMGQLVVRAVTEAMRDLARSIDARLQSTFNLRSLWRKLRAAVTGVPESQLVLRDSLPCRVREIYLLHHEGGLLLWHANSDGSANQDADLIGAMLTAVRDFGEEIMRQAPPPQERALREIQYGEQMLLVEGGRFTYAGILIEGVPTAALRSMVRHSLWRFEEKHRALLERYNGEAALLQPLAQSLFQPLFAHGVQEQGEPPRRRAEVRTS